MTEKSFEEEDNGVDFCGGDEPFVGSVDAGRCGEDEAFGRAGRRLFVRTDVEGFRRMKRLRS